MKYPYLKYLYFLITKRLSYEEIQDKLVGYGLTCPTEDDFDLLMDQIFELCPFDQFKKILQGKGKIRSVKKFLEYMKAIGIYDLWLTESNAKDEREIATLLKAKELIEDPQVNIELNAFILNKLSDEDIIQAFNQKRKISLAKATIEAYKQYFFNIDIMTREDWIIFLTQSSDRVKRVYLSAMHKDNNYLRHLMGFKTKLEYLDVLQDIFSTAYYKFKESTQDGAPNEGHEGARRWAKTLFDAGDRKEKLDAGNMDEFKETLQMKFEFEDSEFPSYADLK